nr:MAG: hypothetical protein [Bacteriophage sp.]
MQKNQWFKWSLPNFQLPEKIFEKKLRVLKFKNYFYGKREATQKTLRSY